MSECSPSSGPTMPSTSANIRFESLFDSVPISCTDSCGVPPLPFSSEESPLNLSRMSRLKGGIERTPRSPMRRLPPPPPLKRKSFAILSLLSVGASRNFHLSCPASTRYTPDCPTGNLFLAFLPEPKTRACPAGPLPGPKSHDLPLRANERRSEERRV